MPAQAGKNFILKVEDDVTPDQYNTVGGFRSNNFSVNGEAIDVSDKDSAGWKELLDGGGLRSMSVSGSGVFKDTAGEEQVRALAFSSALHKFEITTGNGDKFTGTFQLTSYERSGEHAGEETFSISLESSGAITFTDAA